MKNIKFYVVSLLLLTLVLSACQPVDEPQKNGEYIYGEHAILDGLEILLLESFPLQAQVIVSGYLPDGCTELDEITVDRDGNEFLLTIKTRKPSGDVMCTEALVPFEETVDLDILGLDAGTYTVVAQDKQVSFTLDVDNVLEPGDDEAEYTYGSNAVVEDLMINIMESFPLQVSVTLVGYLPDGCTEIEEIKASREGQIFSIEIVTKRPAGDVACTMAIVPFEEVVKLDVQGLPAGEYVVEAGDLQESFTFDVDNTIDDPNDGGKYTLGSDAVLERMILNISETAPIQVSVNLTGYFTDGCTELEEIKVSLEDQTFIIDIVTKRPAGDVACTMAIVPFEAEIPLDLEGLAPGLYIVQCQLMKETFTLPAEGEL
jgi:inhibitor of cysteine peptidase